MMDAKRREIARAALDATIGEKIQAARKNAGLSQKALGEKMGVSGSMIGQYENNLRIPKNETLRRIAAALGTSKTVMLNPHTTYNLPSGYSSVLQYISEKTGYPVDLVVRVLDRPSQVTAKEDATVRMYFTPLLNHPDSEVDSSKDSEAWRKIVYFMPLLNEEGLKAAAEYIDKLVDRPEYQRWPEDE